MQGERTSVETLQRRWLLLTSTEASTLRDEPIHGALGEGSVCGQGSISRTNYRVRGRARVTCASCARILERDLGAP